MNEFIVAGIGGQGVITCSKLILETALDKGYEARSAETIGMAQRGGSVLSHVRIGEKIYSPFIPMGKVDEVISMDSLEALRYQNYLKQYGFVEAPDDLMSRAIISKIPIRSDINIRYYDLGNKWEKKETKKNTNIIMLGIVFAGDRYIISSKDIEKTIVKRFTGDIRSNALEALHLGIGLARGGIN